MHATARVDRTSGGELVPHAPDREDVPGIRRVRLDLRSQPPDVDVDEPAVAEVVVAPDPVEELLAAQDLARVGRQLTEQAEFGTGAVDLDPVAP